MKLIPKNKWLKLVPQIASKSNVSSVQNQGIFVTIEDDLKKILAIIMYLMQMLFLLIKFKDAIPNLF